MSTRFPIWVVEGALPVPTDGTITVTVTEDSNGLGIQLAGSGDEWHTSEQGIHLTPETAVPVLYRLTLVLVSSSFSLVGAQIYRHITEDVNTAHATIVLPASLNEVMIHLLNGIESGSSVIYQLFIGIRNNNTNAVHWPDPTIAFDPQM